MSRATLELSRDEIVELMEQIARSRRGIGAVEVMRSYRDGTLDDPGELIDFLSLADLLSDHDPLHSG